MNILGIETSCDETGAAIVQDGRILSNVISSQVIHQKYGGVVPEISARAHLKWMTPIIRQALDQAALHQSDLDAIAVTYGPGLMGPLLVGVNYAKAMAFALNIPLIGINHIESHLYANFTEDHQPALPAIGLIVSGGHTTLVKIQEGFQYEVLGSTRDDAAGEAFDKVAKMLGLGYPGGPKIDRLAQSGNPSAIEFPRPMIHSQDFDFSFSGLKTAVLVYLKDHPEAATSHLNDICASVQTAIVDVLVNKTLKAALKEQVADIIIAGGVSANSELRQSLFQKARDRGIHVHVPPPVLSTDNGAMVALLGELKLKAGFISGLTLTPQPGLQITNQGT